MALDAGANLVDDFTNLYSRAAPELLKAPKGGLTIAGKYYKGEQFIPRPRLNFGRGGFTNFKSLPSFSTPLKPSPVNFNLPSSVRWGIGVGGAGLGLLYYTKKVID